MSERNILFRLMKSFSLLNQEKKLWLPEQAKRLSPRHRHNIINSTYSFISKRQVCHVKDNFSAKTIKKRNGELKRFFAHGGTSYSLAELSEKDISQLYVHLFKLRFADTVKCYEKDKLNSFLSSVRPLIAGNVLFYDGLPCALDIVLNAKTINIIYSDVPNGGVDPKFSKHSPGSLVMWKNIVDARQTCITHKKEMIFSLGGYAEKWKYKLRWAEALKTGKSLCI